MGRYLRRPLFLMTLTDLRGGGQVCRRMSSCWGQSDDLFSWLDRRHGFGGGEATEVGALLAAGKTLPLT